jgi:hypothetical protein
MQYVKVAWLHNDLTDPVWFYIELGDDGYEVRKVELYLDGRAGYADDAREFGETRLADQPYSLDDIEPPEFELTEISREEFEKIWARTTVSR